MSLVKSFTHLKGRPKEQEALPLLQRIASLVKPIMRKHDWRLPVLAEFFPENESLVGSCTAMLETASCHELAPNRFEGEKILLRLRPSWAPDTFYDEEQLVLVMLHELTHNVHGPHDSKFYALLSKLEQEYEDLKRSGYSGEGFHSVGARLGVGTSHNLPPHLAKIKALEAAERRRKTASVLNGGGKLGGSSIGRKKSPRELAAEAAERRVRDEKSCGSSHGIDAEMEAQRAIQDSVIDVDVDLAPDAPSDKRQLSPEIIVLDGPSKSTNKNRTLASKPSSSSKGLGPSSAVESQPRFKSPGQVSISDEWSCSACTLLNSALVLQCSACYSSRPQDPAAGWTCLTCGEEGMPHDFWSCRYCGQIKRES